MSVPSLNLPRPLAGVLLDLDGTLVDTEPLHMETAAHVLAEEGIVLTRADYHAMAGLADLMFFSKLKERFATKASAAALTDRRTHALLARVRDSALPPNPGVCALLDLLETHSIPRAVASGSVRPMIDALLDAAGLAARLPLRVSGHDDVARPKPAPDVFLAAAKTLGAPPSLCIAIEDSRSGVAAARAAGCCVVFVASPSFPIAPPPGADLALANLHDLVRLLAAHLQHNLR